MKKYLRKAKGATKMTLKEFNRQVRLWFEYTVKTGNYNYQDFRKWLKYIDTVEELKAGFIEIPKNNTVEAYRGIIEKEDDKMKEVIFFDSLEYSKTLKIKWNDYQREKEKNIKEYSEKINSFFMNY